MQNNRIKLIFLIVVLVFIIIIIRVFCLQVVEYRKLNKLAENLWSRNLPVGADRGRILDRHGKVIAGNVTTSSLVLIPNQIKNKDEVSKNLAEVLGVSYDEMYKHVSKKVSIERVHPEGRDLSYEISEKINNFKYDGVYLLKETERYYPYKETLSHVIGYVGIDNQGLSGLELLYDKYLTGTNGSIKYFSDGKGKKLVLPEIYETPTPGMDINLTIDLDLQLILENELTNAEKKYNVEGAIGIVMDPKTGEILAMSNRPTFDPTNYQNYSIETINRNLAIWSSYEPGSTFKILTVAAAVNEGKINLFEDTYFDTGSIRVDGGVLHCWKHKGHGQQTFLEVIENSCNPGFVVMGNKLGKETLFDYIYRFGFGKKTGIDLNGEGKGILFDLEKVGPLELATTSFGQGVSVTALQQVEAVSAIINNGNMYTPFVVKSISDYETGTIIKETKPNLKGKNLIKEESSKLVRYALESVVANGSGHNAYIEGYRIGGKTGTAQKVGQDGKYMVGNYILSFIGFMPADDPKYVVYIALDGAKGVTQYGGTASAPIAKNIFNGIINLYDLKESKDVMPKEYLWYETKYVEVPDVRGLSLKEAKKALNGFTIEYTGIGEVVIETNPSPGKRVKEGSSVKLMLK
ncbi:MAG: stage V sporulation protein D [Tenericutes bacterium]|nr:stage V sporulation protein D [Mycoplasmatota bacterium]